ncbi:DNA polymerase III subunits gamma and tau [Spiroplasma helicoides]|uniref:DNA polymerase III subunit gamma/tau n=1 Tax=Spiroplasma helicoides TaxID=216938 RepID=A0A1B3SJ55_9MOLU|nr:DNA polymerase III subunit gamma/tau [Spiroplasma helicoides]AOG59962.1 DNA polymerase III subunits gamma and tau [Spiroplasma helicoides]
MENKKSLYRIYRPRNLDQVAGHENLKKILIAQFENKTFPHALIFSGQRGTGKTSVAKIIAKTINCENINHYNPCDSCKSCLEFNANSHPDIYEMDAASNNGVDEIRNIKNNVSTLPSISNYKIYIIDEVHMLTNSAFNALLKTLEEPPTHVIFILATTEYTKIPQTIISRCQVFNFKKIHKEALENKIKEVCSFENIEIDQEALEEIFYMSDGSLRDALNFLEQTMTVSKNLITAKELQLVFYISTKEEKIQILRNIFDSKVKDIINYFERANEKGVDFQSTTLGLLDILKEIIIFKMSKSTDTLKILNLDELKEFDHISLKQIFLLSDNLSNSYEKAKNSNISYQYILINILKTIKSFETLISVNENEEHKFNNKQTEEQISKVNNQKVFEDQIQIKEDIIEKNKQNEASEVITNKIDQEHEVKQSSNYNNDFNQTNLVGEEQKLEEEESKQNLTDSIENKIEQIYLIESLEEKLEKLQMAIMYKEIKNINYELQIKDDDILNLLIGAEKDARKQISDHLTNIFLINHNDKNKLSDFICFYNVKVRAANYQSALIVAEDATTAKWINDKLQDLTFRDLVQKEFKKNFAFICIDKKRWESIKEEYQFRKKISLLDTEYKEINVDDFYNNLKEVESENIYLERAKKILDIDIKVVD